MVFCFIRTRLREKSNKPEVFYIVGFSSATAEIGESSPFVGKVTRVDKVLINKGGVLCSVSALSTLGEHKELAEHDEDFVSIVVNMLDMPNDFK